MPQELAFPSGSSGILCRQSFSVFPLTYAESDTPWLGHWLLNSLSRFRFTSLDSAQRASLARPSEIFAPVLAEDAL